MVSWNKFGEPAGAREMRLVDAYLAQCRELLNAKIELETAAAAEKKAQEDLQKAARGKYIREWAAEHGSERLRLQLAAGLDGWPLYLHERLISDLGENAQLDNDGDDQDPLTNPTIEQLETAKDLASNLLGLGQILPERSGDEVLRHVQILPIKFDEDDEGNDGFTIVYARAIWTPGPPELFHKYDVRVRCPDEDD